MKKFMFLFLVLNSFVSFAQKRIYIQFYPNPQVQTDYFFDCASC